MLEIKLDSNALLCNNGLSTNLTNKELELLMILIENKSICLSHELITSKLWGKKYNFEDNLCQLIFNLRKKLKKIGVSNLISNIRGVGYVFDKSNLFSVIKDSSHNLKIIYARNINDDAENVKCDLFHLNKLFNSLCCLFIENDVAIQVYKACESPDVQMKIIELCDKLGF
ncbi:winged helix-turn-helix domain-containing protein [Yokenella regensburgei]|uniref:winged helix-turn-helix domain-containing protein n=1 Tax=Yokenella regensburgei TaxID=158877 RepID=UPI001375BFBF|nr:winged helix-turn-helix domain-containing protein [Yokenella regensburgei]KAF1366655.1 DNA-binding winged helix-turn-helix (wHTH) protein [Yokenella regensburgei]